jgi:hypothetical protein
MQIDSFCRLGRLYKPLKSIHFGDPCLESDCFPLEMGGLGAAETTIVAGELH